MSRKRPEPLFDDDNPEWTEEDFAKARPAAEVLPADVLKAFRRTRGPQKSVPVKRPISIRLDPDVIDHFKAQGPGWQARMNQALRRAAGL